MSEKIWTFVIGGIVAIGLPAVVFAVLEFAQ